MIEAFETRKQLNKKEKVRQEFKVIQIEVLYTISEEAINAQKKGNNVNLLALITAREDEGDGEVEDRAIQVDVVIQGYACSSSGCSMS